MPSIRADARTLNPLPMCAKFRVETEFPKRQKALRIERELPKEQKPIVDKAPRREILRTESADPILAEHMTERAFIYPI